MVGDRKWVKVRLSKVKEGEREMCKGAFKAGGDYIDIVTTVVGEGRAKVVVGTVPVWIPR